MARFILVRHGQTEWNRVERFRGQFDVPLNETGLAQAKATGQHIAAQWQPAAVYSSPLTRAVRTADTIAAHFSLPVRLHSGLTDINYGEWQGLTPEEVMARWPHEHYAWCHRPHLARIPGGEMLDEIRGRTMRAINEIGAQHEQQDIVLVSHTVVNRVILLAILGLGNDHFWHLSQETGAINVFAVGTEGFTLVTMNDACHLRT